MIRKTARVYWLPLESKMPLFKQGDSRLPVSISQQRVNEKLERLVKEGIKPGNRDLGDRPVREGYLVCPIRWARGCSLEVILGVEVAVHEDHSISGRQVHPNTPWGRNAEVTGNAHERSRAGRDCLENAL